jgi:hypothetical protein
VIRLINPIIFRYYRIQDSSVNIVTGLGAGSRGFGSRKGKGFISLLRHRVQTGSGAHPASYPMALSLGVKRWGREADRSPPSNAEVKDCGVYLHSPNTPSWRGAQSPGATLRFALVKNIAFWFCLCVSTDVFGSYNLVVPYFWTLYGRYKSFVAETSLILESINETGNTGAQTHQCKWKNNA